MPKSVRKFIREGKARIRREVLDVKEHKALISALYDRTAKKPKEEKKEKPKEKADNKKKKAKK